MIVFCYAGSEGHCAVLARDDTGLLPAELGPWKKLGTMEINAGDSDRLGMPTNLTLQNLEQHGSHFFQLSMTWEEK